MISESIIKTVLEKVLCLKENEKFLVITDTDKEELAKPFYDYAKNISDAEIIMFKALNVDGEEPPQEVSESMKNKDVVLIITKASLTHTKAVREALTTGGRGVSCPGITKEMLERCVDIDYNQLKQFHNFLHPIIKSSQEIKITDDNGTNIIVKVRNTRGDSESLIKDQPGKAGNLPMGEVDSGIETANGKIVIDGSMSGVGIINNPIELEVKDKMVKIISENSESKKLKELLDNIGENAYLLAELGIGTNPKSILTGEVLEDEKIKGTIHFAVGNDTTYGGDNNVPIHLDGVITKPTMIVDNKVIIRNGRYV
jgi:leucyl aminopeptidase (aminopeptidase T)